jgi:K+-transporting ATPase ATPase A chain
MTLNSYLQIVFYLVVLIGLAKPLGWYMARVFEGQSCGLDRALGPLERLIYRLSGVRSDEEMNWKAYALAMLLFNFAGLIVLYGLQRLQAWLPLNPQGFGAVTPDSSFNTAVSFASNTNWQGYGGETTMSYLTQMLGLTVQNFVSAATGMAVLVALIRGLARRSAQTIGNFWVDLTRTTLYILLPLAIVLALIQVSQGVIQNFDAYKNVPLLQPTVDADGKAVTEQVLAMGPAASQIAIKQLGTNGGGFFNVNSAHPFENATPLSNFFEMLAILLISGGLCYTFGKMVGDTRQGWAVLAAMTIIFVALLALCVGAEQSGNPAFAKMGIDQNANALQAGGNMEGKEVRFGIANSALWATATTAASNGSVNSMHDSYTPLGGLVPMWLMQLGEVIFGGVGSGLYGMLVFAIIAVFVAGLMVGRTPEYLGKKIEAFEMKMAALVILFPPIAVLGGVALSIIFKAGGFQDGGPHGFSELLYAYSSQGNNNGSAFAGFGANIPFHNTLGGLAMLIARYWLAIPTLAIAGSLAQKKVVPAGPGTLPTHNTLFIILLIGVVIVVGALTFIPALALGPIVEHLIMLGA